jgi:gamma-glutamylcyclotransferase
MGLPVVGKAHEGQQAGAPFHWFIYGSSLDRDAFAQWAQEHGYRVPDFSGAVPARLDGFRLSFDVRSKFWGGAVASLTPEAGASVEGIALPMPGDAHGLVDHKEGAISGLFQPLDVSVTPLAGGAPISALAYRAAENRRLAAEETPSVTFVETLLKGGRAFGLSDGYLTSLRRRLP